MLNGNVGCVNQVLDSKILITPFPPKDYLLSSTPLALGIRSIH